MLVPKTWTAGAVWCRATHGVHCAAAQGGASRSSAFDAWAVHYSKTYSSEEVRRFVCLYSAYLLMLREAMAWSLRLGRHSRCAAQLAPTDAHLLTHSEPVLRTW